MSAASRPRDCPCRSRLRYAACCGPLHAGTRAPEGPEALLRARFAAFSLGLGAFLVRTLTSDHPDHAAPEADLVRALSDAHHAQRFMGLEVLRAASRGDAGEALYVARVFARGKDVSFAELADFRFEAGAWRYASGAVLPAERLPKGAEELSRAAFLALVAEAGG